MLPDFEDGLLPKGVHPATWEEVVERFGWNPWRQSLLAGLLRALQDLSAAGCRRAWLDGSFVTDVNVPGDFDLCWDMDGVEVHLLTPALRDVTPPRAIQKSEYGGDVIPNITEAATGMPFLDFFQEEAETGRPRGILVLDLEAFA